jgi:predicted RNA-binding Zn-ribbon protein involved in translation (DUF1610 family)
MASNHVPLLAAQRWKLWLAFAVILAAGAFMWFDAWFSTVLQLPRYVPTLIGTSLGLVALLVACLSIRCPSCGKRFVWHALSTMPSHSWLEWLLVESTCPKCGFQSSRTEARSESGA